VFPDAVVPVICRPADVDVGVLLQHVKLKATSAAVIGEPSLNFTPCGS
jgi:hypothetical protein